jgi:hypothetical protein
MIALLIHTAAEAVGWIFIAGMFFNWLATKLDDWEK